MIDRNELSKHLGKVFAFMDKASGEGLHFADNNFPDNDLEASDIIVDLATVLELELIDCADIPSSITEAVLAALAPTPAADEVETLKDNLMRALYGVPEHLVQHLPTAYHDTVRECARAAIAALQARSAEGWKCGVAKSVGANQPQDCNWPVCGCDPYAAKVIAALEESGALQSDPAEPAGEEPVLYQSRTRPTWDRAPNWTGWQDCSREAFDCIQAKPIVNDWVSEARALYARPVTPTNPERLVEARAKAFEEAAKVAETLRIGGGTLSSWIRTNESPMGATQRHIAEAIRALSAAPLKGEGE